MAISVDRKILIMENRLLRGVPVEAVATWKFVIDAGANGTFEIRGGKQKYTLANTLGIYNAMTGAQIRQAAEDAVATSLVGLITYDSIS